MPGCLSIVLHAHLPFVRHAEHERFLEESWLYEATIESYLPLLEVFEGWRRDGIPARVALVLSPTLCVMLEDSLLRRRFAARLDQWVGLAEQEVARTRFEPEFNRNARMYRERFPRLRELYRQAQGDLVGAFRRCQEAGVIELMTCAATHAVLPLWTRPISGLRAQVRTAVERHERCFGVRPRGFWLPECAYAPAVEPVLKEHGIRWFLVDTRGLTHARPQPRYGAYAPVITPEGLAAFGRDPVSANQVWSREGGYPGDPGYRDFYRDIGFDLDLDYVEPFLPSPGQRGFTGLKYYRITGPGEPKEPYARTAALERVEAHAADFVARRVAHLEQLSSAMETPPIVVAPYDAELFGHWWFEGPEFLDAVARRAVCARLPMLTPGDYLRNSPRHQVAAPGASSWGDAGYWRVWLNEANAWVYPPVLDAAEELERLVKRHGEASGFAGRALRLASQELMQLQASDWPFILSAGTHAAYARKRIAEHLERFRSLTGQLDQGEFAADRIAAWERSDLLFGELTGPVAGKKPDAGISRAVRR